MSDETVSLKKHTDIINALVAALKGLVPEFGSVEETPELQQARTVLHAVKGDAVYVYVIARNGDGWFVSPVAKDSIPTGTKGYPTPERAWSALANLRGKAKQAA